MQYIPFADPFMMTSNARRDAERINNWFEIDEPMKLQSEIVLRVTLQLVESTDTVSFARLMTSLVLLDS